MKFVIKQILISTALFLLIAPAMAAEGPAKGTKSYQAGHFDQGATSEHPAQVSVQQPDDVSAIAPAAGDSIPMEDKAAAGKKSFREEMRLPRKN